MGAAKKQKSYSRAASVARTMRVAMARENILSQGELADLIRISKTTMSKRLADGSAWKLSELWGLDKILHFSDDEILTLIKCARK